MGNTRDIAPVKAILGPTNTGKTHLAIERMCGHSSGAIGFPLRLLAREVYDRVVAIKGEAQTALITGEERIEPPNARYFLCTAEAMGRGMDRHAFVALDEAQIGANPERGHVFTDHLLNSRGREETMLLGSATLEPLVRALEPDAQIETRPRFSTLKHTGPRKLSRLPPRSAIVAFSAEQVYAVAEMLRRFKGGSAVVMGALSPQTRNRQVEMFQNGEVDYIVATDAIGMGLNLDIDHVAFASLTKFDGVRKRRLQPAEMAQIAGRAGRHQRDGTFGTLSGQGKDLRGAGPPVELTEEEVYALEEHRFKPLTHLFWREPEPRFDDVATLIADLERAPSDEALRRAPEAIDLAVLKRLAETEEGVSTPRGAGEVRRFWELCRLPDFRSSGVEMHARFVARLWRDLRGGYIGADYVAARIAELDTTSGDIDTLQGRIAAIRSWAYICQRPDWVLARDEMAARARTAEARLSDALHARLAERFVNRRTALLMKSLGQDASLLPVSLGEDGIVSVDEEPIGTVEGLSFKVDPATRHDDRKLLLAAAERALPALLGKRVSELVDGDMASLELRDGAIRWDGRVLARLEPRPGRLHPAVILVQDLSFVPDADRQALQGALDDWLTAKLAPLLPLGRLIDASTDPNAGSQARALLLKLIDGAGHLAREDAGIEHLPKELRPFLRRLGVTFGALDIFVPALLKPGPRALLKDAGMDRRPLDAQMRSVVEWNGRGKPSGYRRLAARQAVRLDIAEKIVRAAHQARAEGNRKRFAIDPALAISTGLTRDSFERLLWLAGFRQRKGKALGEGHHGPPAPALWEWRPRRVGGPVRGPGAKPAADRAGRKGKSGSRKRRSADRPGPKRSQGGQDRPNPNGAFAGLAELLK